MEIEVAIADDHFIFKQGIEALLTYIPGMKLVIKASNGSDLLNSIKSKPPDVILLDLRMPVMDGLSTLFVLNKQYPQIKVIVLTLSEDHLEIKKALKTGAVASLSKNSSPEILIRTIRECLNTAV